MRLSDSKEYDSSSLGTLVLVFICLPFFISCTSHSLKVKRASEINTFDVERFSEDLRGLMKPVDTTDTTHKIQSIAENVRYAYQLNDYAPFWISHDKASKAADTLLKELEDLRFDGLDPEKYHLSTLQQLKANLKSNGTGVELSHYIAFDTALTYSYLAAAHDLLLGCIVPSTADSLWYHPNDTSWQGPKSLADVGKYTSLNAYRSVFPTYGLLRQEYGRYLGLLNDSALNASIAALQGKTSISKHDSAEKAAVTNIIMTEVPWADTTSDDSTTGWAKMIGNYQYYVDLKPTGKLDKTTIEYLTTPPQHWADELKANMERVRWMEKKLSDLYVLVDVPLMHLFLRQDGANAMYMRVVVGKPIRQTPSLEATMANVVINPPWGVPPTILKKDVLPGITREGQKYLAEKGLAVYDHKGHKVNVKITAANYKKYIYKQDPGDDNALGYVKFNLPNKWDIYLHDTPHRGDFSKDYRALSSGCIRLQQPQQMAIYILSQLEKRDFDQARLDSLIQTHKTRWEVLKTKIPVHIVYLTAFEDTTGHHIRFVKDIYKRDSALVSLLNK